MVPASDGKTTYLGAPWQMETLPNQSHYVGPLPDRSCALACTFAMLSSPFETRLHSSTSILMLAEPQTVQIQAQPLRAHQTGFKTHLHLALYPARRLPSPATLHASPPT